MSRARHAPSTSRDSKAKKHADVDPFAGDDEPWADDDVPLPPLRDERDDVRFWRGLLLGLVLSGLAWLVLGIALVVLYNVLR
ncbi:MAG: hypothetical protein ACRDNB_00790 [Gaiellaceae bacterium]